MIRTPKLMVMLFATACASTSLPPRVSPERVTEAEDLFSEFNQKLNALPSGSPIDPAWIETQLMTILAKDPRHLLARYNLAVLADESGNQDLALERYETLLAVSPDFLPALENRLALTTRELPALEASDQYRRFVQAHPDTAIGRLALARISMQLADPARAAELARDALSRAPAAIEGYRILAGSLLAQRQYSNAELVVGRGLAFAPDDVELLRLQGEVSVARGDIALGLAQLRSVAERYPDDLDAQRTLVDAALDYHDYGTALGHAEILASKLDGLPRRRAILDVAIAARGLGAYERAEKELLELLEEGEIPEARWNLAVLYHYCMGRYEDAARAYRAWAKTQAGDDRAVAETAARTALLRARSMRKSSRGEANAYEEAPQYLREYLTGPRWEGGRRPVVKDAD